MKSGISFHAVEVVFDNFINYIAEQRPLVAGNALKFFELNRVKRKGNPLGAATVFFRFGLWGYRTPDECVEARHWPALLLFDTRRSRGGFIPSLPFFELPFHRIIQGFLQERLQVVGKVLTRF